MLQTPASAPGAPPLGLLPFVRVMGSPRPVAGFAAPTANPALAKANLKLPTKKQALHTFLQGRTFDDARIPDRPPASCGELLCLHMFVSCGALETVARRLPHPQGKEYTYQSYSEAALARRQQALARCPPSSPADAFLEREYWRLVESQSEEMTVDYANDLDSRRRASGCAFQTWTQPLRTAG